MFGQLMTDKLSSNSGEGTLGAAMRASFGSGYVCDPMSLANAWPSMGFCRNPSNGQA